MEKLGRDSGRIYTHSSYRILVSVLIYIYISIDAKNIVTNLFEHIETTYEENTGIFNI